MSVWLNVCSSCRTTSEISLFTDAETGRRIFDMLENKFKWQRDNGFIRSLTDSVMDFEYRIQKQAEALERARLLNEQAEQLKKEADKLGKP